MIKDLSAYVPLIIVTVFAIIAARAIVASICRIDKVRRYLAEPVEYGDLLFLFAMAAWVFWQVNRGYVVEGFRSLIISIVLMIGGLVLVILGVNYGAVRFRKFFRR